MKKHTIADVSFIIIHHSIITFIFKGKDHPDQKTWSRKGS